MIHLVITDRQGNRWKDCAVFHSMDEARKYADMLLYYNHDGEILNIEIKGE